MSASIPPVAFGCVAEPTPRFYDQTLRLVRSIRWFGGSLASADVFVCFVGEVAPAHKAALEALGATVRLVEPFNPHNRFSNKVRFLELPELAQYETAVLLDCDMALVQDPAPFFAQPALQLMIADLPTVPSERLQWLCRHFGLAAPEATYRTTCSEEPTVWYCNTAVMILPTAWLAQVLPTWQEYILRLCAEPALLDPPYNHCNQAAMTLTYIAHAPPFAGLPVAMNFPLHQTGRRPTEAMLRADPVILHYHDRVDADGLLLPVPYPLAQARIEQLNARLRRAGRAPVVPQEQRGAVCIAGMHRSGTSLVAQILHRCGVWLGPEAELAAPAADNLDGYWEHPEFHRLNEALLAHFGGGWDAAPAFPPDWETLPELEPLRVRARDLIASSPPIWGWKDPRSSLTMPFWRGLIPQLKVVICVRHPLEVALSLSRRGMSSLAFGLRLWLTYYERLLATVPPAERLITHYETYFASPLAEAERVLDWLGLPALGENAPRAEGIVSAALRHQRGTAAELLAVAVPRAVIELYRRLCEEAGVPECAAPHVLAVEATREQPDPQPATLATRLAAALALLRTRENDLAALQRALAASRTELDVLRHVLDARDADVAYLRPTLAAREAELVGYERELAATREVLAAREVELVGYERELAATRQVLSEWEGQGGQSHP